MCYGQKRKGGRGKKEYDVRKGGYAHNGMAELHIKKTVYNSQRKHITL